MENILKTWGLCDRIEAQAREYDGSLTLARVSEQHHNIYKIVSKDGEVNAYVTGRLSYGADGDTAAYPAVGDWVMAEESDGDWRIHHVLHRKSVFARKAPGASENGSKVQIVAANVDKVFICMALNEDYNLRRLERYLSIAWDSGALPVVVLTKADLCGDLEERVAEASSVAIGVTVIVCSAVENAEASGLSPSDAVKPHIKDGETTAFIGSSGVGKSTLINALLGESVLATGDTQAGGKGRHTTTFRQLIPIPPYGLVIDTPGMRELGVISADVSKTFEDIEALANGCKFGDCAHENEPDCAVLAAVQSGELDASRLNSFKKLKAEVNYTGMSAKQIENEKINRMFGGKNEMKQFMREIKQKNKKR